MGGLETVMVFPEGLDLPQLAAFPLVGEAKGRAALTRYIEGMLDLARDLDHGFILDTPTWRASAGWGPSMGMSPDEIDAARDQGCPVTLSFTVETDGRLRAGMPLSEAIARTDAETGAYPAWYGINCAHPSHFRDELKGAWLSRLDAIRANASQKGHDELDAAADLDDGDPQALAEDYRALSLMLPALHVLGGCCGTDLRRVTAIGHACRH